MGQLREWWIGFRNGKLSDPTFQKWASCFPLTRPIARRSAAELFDVVAGFVYSQVLLACVETDLLVRLAKGPRDAESLAIEISLPTEGTLRLLKAAAALKLTQDLGNGRFALGPNGAALLGNPGIAEMVRHHRLLYADLANPVAALKTKGGGALADYWAYASGDSADAVAAYSKLMAASQPMIAEQVLDTYNFGKHRRLMDVGGGQGAFLMAVAARYPKLLLSLFDLPAVAERARAVLGNQVAVYGGSFLADSLPLDADIITLVRILHDHDDVPAMILLRSIYAALPKGGTLLIAEPLAATKSAIAMGEAYFGLYLHAMGSGRPRTYAEIKAMLCIAGFTKVRRTQTAIPLTASIIIAER